jgi:hypothetical protein
MAYYSRYITEGKDVMFGVSLLRLVTSEPLDDVMKAVGCILVDSEVSVLMHCVPTAVAPSSFIGFGLMSNFWNT